MTTLAARCSTLLATLALASACAAPEADPAAAPAVDVETTARGVGMSSEVTGFGNNPGGLRGYKYVPENMPPNAPLVLALHACSQTATDYRRSGWNELADQHKFYVLYPEQQTNNNALRCFNWAGEFGDPLNLTRGEGENQSIIQMIEKLKADHSIDASRIFIMGHSGGAAQTSLMIATWPEVFAGAGVIAGIPYNCTTTFTQVSTCLSPGINRTAQEWGDRARAGRMGYSGPRPRVSIWHGSADNTVAVMNQTELLEQWTNVHGIDMTADATDMVDGATRNRYQDASGTTLVETILIPNMGHGTPVDPQASCGSTGAYFLDNNICAVSRLADFWGLTGMTMPGDTTPPTVSITAPMNNASVTGSVNVQIAAMDNTAVTRVDVAVNGTVRQMITSAPYQWMWSTAGLANGQYTLRATAYDAAANSAFAEVRVTVTGGVMDTRAPTVNVTAPANAATVSGVVDLTATAMDDFAVAKVEFLVDGTKVGESANAPYSYSWDSTTVAVGSRRISARATDAAGNAATDDDTTVTVERAVITEGFVETFSGANQSPDRPGWSLGAWRSDTADHTGQASSGALFASVTPDRSTVEARATVPVRVGTTDTELVLWRRMILRPGSAGASASFRVLVSSNGQETTLHETAATSAAVTESDWTQLKLDLSSQAGRDVTLAFIVLGDDTNGPLTDARAWIDDLRLGPPSGTMMPTDTTPPVVRFTAPAAGSSISGVVTVKVDATDETAMSQVLLFLGSDLIGSDYRAPFEFLWDTKVFPEGPQTLTVRAFDRAGNLAMAELAVTVTRAAAEPEPSPSAPAQVAAGRRYIGCTTTGTADGGWLLVGLVLAARHLSRRRR
jgi:poly(hydroxyalkanoate) depolymerase family esterase